MRARKSSLSRVALWVLAWLNWVTLKSRPCLPKSRLALPWVRLTSCTLIAKCSAGCNSLSVKFFCLQKTSATAHVTRICRTPSRQCLLVRLFRSLTRMTPWLSLKSRWAITTSSQAMWRCSLMQTCSSSLRMKMACSMTIRRRIRTHAC